MYIYVYLYNTVYRKDMNKEELYAGDIHIHTYVAERESD